MLIDQGQALLRAICENPRDDFVRLAYADWLEEEGQVERSEFIRVHIERHNDIDYAPNGVRPMTLEMATENRLAGSKQFRFLANFLYKNAAKWCSLPFEILQHAGWHRGFISEIHCTLKDWYNGICDAYGAMGEGHGPQIVTQQPIERVTLADKTAYEFEGYFFFHRGNEQKWTHHASQFLPGEIFDFLLLDGHWFDYQYAKASLKTEKEAAHALSQACINWARREAGLPLLT